MITPKWLRDYRREPEIRRLRHYRRRWALGSRDVIALPPGAITITHGTRPDGWRGW